ncbi:MAG: glucose-6-phosphate isomerase [Phycisphaerae bacterium]
MDELSLWHRFKRYYVRAETIGLSIDISRMYFADTFFSQMQDSMGRAFKEMDALEKGETANPDESRMVGHYWLRAPELSPTPEIRAAITQMVDDIKSFAAAVHGGTITSPRGKRFTHLMVIGIGGSALGPQFVGDALGGWPMSFGHGGRDDIRSGEPPDDHRVPHLQRRWATPRMQVSFCDNTDPDGIDRTLDRIGSALATALTVVISKSGRTAETGNGMLEVQHAYERAGLEFAPCAVAITQEGSKLDQLAKSEKWLKRFGMWDWVGGRTSELSAVGLLPAALQGCDIDAMLAGAAACDAVTRVPDVPTNPAALLALMWFHAGDGRGSKDMVILPYKDRLALLGKYLQQLVMESLGKRLDRSGRVVHQGITVYGNKGSTDQHAYVQQLRDGLNNFFVTFIEVGKDRVGPSIDVEENVTCGDYLHGFLLGTRKALYEAERESITLTIDEVSPRSVGVLIALFERAVGLYASLVDVNAYHQPGVEAGKKAAAEVIEIQRALLAAMGDKPGNHQTAESWAQTIGQPDQVETVFSVLEHLATNRPGSVKSQPGTSPFDTTFGRG